LDAFKNNDLELAKVVIKKDDQVDQYEEEIAKQALKIIWREQPVASDLRLVTGILKLITDLERIGDHATDIAEMTLHLEGSLNKRVLPITSKMAEIVEEMVLLSIKGLVHVNEEIAQEVIKKDDLVDELFQQLITKMTTELKNDKIDANELIYVLMVAKYFERVGDHAVNIAQWIIFMVKGTHKNTLLF
jgi:phosphate transport system protein